MSDFTPSDAFFLDGDGNEVHIGEMVTYESRLASGDRITKCGEVEGVTYRGVPVAVTVKVSGCGKNMPSHKVTAIDGSTTEGKLRLLVAQSGGRIDNEAIAALAKELGQ
jgi:hypothetical protein